MPPAHYLDAIDRFDAEFFGLAPREAQSVDPQQRLLLEVAWEAMEDAGQVNLAGSSTGVFVGISTSDYSRLLFNGAQRADAYYGTGSALSIAANRLSYILDLHGPSWAVDTACSSSLVAVHNACQSLRLGECDAAFAGGVNLIVSTELTGALAEARMLSSDGRCKTFDAEADGYGRGEGCGIVILKRHSDALRDGDKILALISGSAVNQDGRSNGLTAPNGLAQEEVIRRALDSAGIEPRAIGYVETHGTGTPLGDPIEVNALKAVLSRGRALEQPCFIGSAKTNIGHLEAAAGIAGLIKAVLCLQHRELPPHLHLNRLNPHIELDGTPFSIPTARQPWPASASPRTAGVSSFGFGGTNAHVIVREAEPAFAAEAEAILEAAEPGPQAFALSAKNPDALRNLATAYGSYLDAHPGVALADICFSANTGRMHFRHRSCAVAETPGQLRDQLAAVAAGERAPGVTAALAPLSSHPKVVFLFTGQGSHYPGMGRELFRTEPQFRQSLEDCDRILRPILETPLLDVLYGTPEQSALLEQTRYAQPALFALEYALAALWRSWGIEPSAVIGHSLGEYVAACVAGVFNLGDGLKLVAERGRLMQAAPGKGEMAAVFADAKQVGEIVASLSGDLSIAALNGPANTVVSGSAEAVAATIEIFKSRGIATQRLRTAHAFHSALMDPAVAAFERVASMVTYHRPRIELISNVSGTIASEDVTTADYWCRQLRQPVQFAAGMACIIARGYRNFLELGPGPILTGLAHGCVSDDTGFAFLTSLRPGHSDRKQMLDSLAALYVRGASIDWRAVYPGSGHRQLRLPTYPFRRRRYWIPVVPTLKSEPSEQSLPPGGNPLLGRRIRSAIARNEIEYESLISLRHMPYLADHRLSDSVLLPSSIYLEMAFAAAEDLSGKAPVEVTNYQIVQGASLDQNSERLLHLVLRPDPKGAHYEFEILGADASSKHPVRWVTHATGALRPVTTAGPAAELLPAIRSRLTHELPVAVFYDQLQSWGLQLAGRFRSVERLWTGDREALGEIRLSEARPESDFRVDPVLLDAAFQIVGAILKPNAAPQTVVQVGIDTITLHAAPGRHVLSHARLRGPAPVPGQTMVADVRLFSPDGSLIAVIDGVRLKALPQGTTATPQTPQPGQVYEVQWHPRPLNDVAPVPSPEDLNRTFLAGLAEWRASPKLAEHSKAVTAIEAFCSHAAAVAFRDLGCRTGDRGSFTTDDVMRRLAVAPRHRRLLERMLNMLREDGWLVGRDADWQLIRTPTHEELRLKLDQTRRDHPDAATELDLLGRASQSLAQVLRETCHPNDVLFPDGDLSLLTRLYRASPPAAMMNSLVERAVAAATQRWPEDRRLRILEIGAGTGATTSQLLPLLPAQRTEYVFSDVSDVFTKNAAATFQAYPFLRPALLDIDRDPVDQGFSGQQFDIIVAANVLHATAKLGRTLQHVRKLMAPGGLLVLLEATNPSRFLDMTFGLTEGWWRFGEDPSRSAHCLIGADQWKTLLETNGFEGFCHASSDDAASVTLAAQAVITARAASTELPGRTGRPGHWLVLADQGGTGEELSRLLRAQGAETTVIAWSAQAPDGQARIAIDQPADYSRIVAEVLAKTSPLQGVVHLWSLDARLAEPFDNRALQQAIELGCRSALHLAQALIGAQLRNPVPVYLVTRGATNALPGQASSKQAPDGLVQAPLWGLGKVLASEHEELRCRLIDLDPAEAPKASTLFQEIWLAGEATENRVAIRNGTRYAARLIETHSAAGSVHINADRTYLITGGLGGIGLRVAAWLVEQGARHLVLLGRSRGSPAAAQAIHSFEQAGVRILTARADVSDFDQLAAVLDDMKAELPPLAGVIHSAGTFADRLIANHDWTLFEDVFAAKIHGAWNLHRLTEGLPLDFFVLFSSASTLMGGAGLANYVAANEFLDALAPYRRSLGLPGLSIAWGPWADVGMATLVGGTREAEWQAMGMRPIPSVGALAALGRVLGSEAAGVGVMSVDWTQFRGHASKAALGKFTELLATTPNSQLMERSSFRRRLKDAPHHERRPMLLNHVRLEVQAVLGWDRAEQINLRHGFFELGMDSLQANELRNRLQSSLDCALSPTLTFKYPTTAELTENLAGLIFAKADDLLQRDAHHAEPPAADEPASEIEVQLTIDRELAQLERLLGGE